MSTLLIFSDSKSCPTMRNEIPVDVPDSFLFVEHGGERRVVLTAFEVDRLKRFDRRRHHRRARQTDLRARPRTREILSREPIVIDLAPRNPDSGFYSDMTWTFAVGEPDEELAGFHTLVLKGLEQAKNIAAAGVRSEDIYRDVCELFDRRGFETELTKEPGEIVRSGFFHGLDHGVGLAVHEPPYLARSNETLISGDVVTLEPGLYRDGYGGCRRGSRRDHRRLVPNDHAVPLRPGPCQQRPLRSNATKALRVQLAASININPKERT